jgi:Uma2 family endonuclease
MRQTPTIAEVVIGPDSAGLLMTADEFDAMEDCDDNYRVELVNGVLVVTSIPLPQETGPNDLLGYFLIAYQVGHPHGRALDLSLPQQYVRTPTSRRLADRLIWAGLGRTPNLKRDVANIAVEFVSADRRSQQHDYVDKLKEYMAAGIREYWIIDRFRRTLTVYHNRPKQPRQQVVQEKDTYVSARLPGFEVPLAKLLEVADRLAEAE